MKQLMQQDSLPLPVTQLGIENNPALAQKRTRMHGRAARASAK